MRMHIRIRFEVLGTSAGGVVTPRGSVGTALVEGAGPSGSSIMRVVMRTMVVMVVGGIMPAPVVRFL